MRFVARAIWGSLVLIACAAVLWFGVSSYSEARQSAAEGRTKRPAPERIYTVRDIVLTAVTAAPKMTAYGEVAAWRNLELRADASGRIVDIAPELREGMAVERGAMLVRLDPTTIASRQADSLTVLTDARSSQTQAQQSFALARADLEAAIRQLKLRNSALQRQRDLLNRGIASSVTVENAQLAASAAEQSVASRRTAYVTAKQRVQQAASGIERAEIAVNNARLDVAETQVVAPFAGVLTDVRATLGSLISPNETLATLIDMRSLEVAFRVTDAQYAAMLDQNGSLIPLDAQVSLNLGERVIAAKAVLDRPAATIGAEGGRTIYARIETAGESPMRPGDFVKVTVEEPPLEDVAVIPARAASDDGDIFIIGADARLERVKATILRRLPDSLIVTDVPFGARIVAERRPQLGPGIKVQSPEEAAQREAEAKVKREERRKNRDQGGKPSGAGDKPTAEGGKPPSARERGERRQNASGAKPEKAAP